MLVLYKKVILPLWQYVKNVGFSMLTRSNEFIQEEILAPGSCGRDLLGRVEIRGTLEVGDSGTEGLR